MLFSSFSFTDSFVYNTLNNYGSVGLINMPSARFYSEGSFAFNFYMGDPDRKVTMMAAPYDWLEASFFYTSIQNKPYCSGVESYCKQDYKDKGFNIKLRIKEEDFFPAIAIGINDLAGTGLYNSEYIVASYGLNNFDIHFGLGWGVLNGKSDLANPLKIIDDSFGNRPNFYDGFGGNLDKRRFFSSEDVSAFFGFTYALNEKYLFKFERDTTLTPGRVGFDSPKSSFSAGLDLNVNPNLTFGVSVERNNLISLKISYKKALSSKPNYTYKRGVKDDKSSSYEHLRSSLQRNNIGVNKIVKDKETVGIEITQFQHESKEIIEEIIFSAVQESELKERLLVNYKVANLIASENYDDQFVSRSNIIYERKASKKFSTSTNFNMRPFLASREDFLKLALMVENNSEYVFSEGFFFSSNLKYTLWDNFDNLNIPPVDTYPAQVRSDVKDYLKNFNQKLIIGRAQFDYQTTISKNNHLMLTGGILEEMFSGIGGEYLYLNSNKNFGVGLEVFRVYKRDYELQFGLMDYQSTTGHVNFYYRNLSRTPFDMQISFGKYLAGDLGGTIELSRIFSNGVKFGVFATFTDVSRSQFGEGSFDKGIFFKVPIFRNLVDYTWRPLTKDPGQKLIRKHSLHDFLIKFEPLN